MSDSEKLAKLVQYVNRLAQYASQLEARIEHLEAGVQGPTTSSRTPESTHAAGGTGDAKFRPA